MSMSTSPTFSASRTRLSGIRSCTSRAVVVLPTPCVPFSQMIMAGSYRGRPADGIGRAMDPGRPGRRSDGGPGWRGGGDPAQPDDAPPRARKDTMLCIVYSSTAERSFDDIDLAQLLAQSRATNEAHGLTGLLVHRQGRFLQLIEGEDADVRERMDAILADDRHGRISTLMEEHITERQFPDWTMGMAKYDARVAERIPGYRDTFDDLQGERPDDAIRPALLELIRWFQEDTGRLS